MRYRVVGLAGAFLALMTACDQGPSIAGPSMQPATQPANQAIVSKTNEQDVPWAQEEENPCTGDLVTMQGTTHYLFNVVANENGGYHLYTRSNSKGTGLGAPSGYTYKVSEEFAYSEQNPQGEQFTLHQVERLLILAPKSVDNYIRHMVFKLTVNANGVPTASFERAFTECRG